MRIPFTRISICLAAIAAFTSVEAQAQMSNRPFSFKTPGANGVGMSQAGQQAILNEHMTGATPNVLLRNPSGGLLNVQRGPERIAIVTEPGGDLLPGFRRGFRRGSQGIRYGVFNSFFVPSARRNSTQTLYLLEIESNVPVDTWTTRVVSDGAVGFGPVSPVNAWTGYVYGMGPRIYRQRY